MKEDAAAVDTHDAIHDHIDEPYPPIADYAMISDCRCAALISRSGSVDWCCMPRFDDDSCFGRLLDWERGGYCAIKPVGTGIKSARRYLPQTMILETRFMCEGGEAVLYDFFAINGGHGDACFDYVRIVDGVRGEVEMKAEIAPRFDYGEVNPHIRCGTNGAMVLTGSNKGMLIHADFEMNIVDEHCLESRFRLRAGERRRLLLRFQMPDRIDEASRGPVPGADEIDAGFERTRGWWEQWCKRARPPCELDVQTLRSLIILKALTYEPTGAVIAAPTTSLPEALGGTRNWDYRYSWVRDSVFVVRVLERMGYATEAGRFHEFIQRSAAGSAEQLQIMYGVDGKRRLSEVELSLLKGYRGSQPVRIGNHASKQRQSDIYGELLMMAWQWHASGYDTDPEYWSFLQSVLETVCACWGEPDHGIWEMRTVPQHFVHSKVMCWAALDKGIRMAQDMGVDAPLAHWRDVREQIRHAVEQQGYDEKRGIFTQSFGHPHLDAALVLMPRVGFIDYRDARMMRTVDAICSELDHNGLILRYKAPDGLPDNEGTFLPCTFWLVACLARQGRMDEAWRYYRRAVACANDIGLLPEEFDSSNKVMLGNFPQALTHVSQVGARMALAGVE